MPAQAGQMCASPVKVGKEAGSTDHDAALQRDLSHQLPWDTPCCGSIKGVE